MDLEFKRDDDRGTIEVWFRGKYLGDIGRAEAQDTADALQELLEND